MNAHLLPFPLVGCAISFSAGTLSPNPSKWRVVSSNGSRKSLYLLKRFPDLDPFLAGLPVLINAYPAMFNPPAKVVFIDSYGRWQTICAALHLAASHSLSCIITSMPLTVAELLLRVIQEKTPPPSRILLLLGGYYCPNSLECFLVDLLRRAGVDVSVLHLYGIGEIESGLLGGRRGKGSSEIAFKSIDPDWHPVLSGRFLAFQNLTEPNRIETTDDPCEISGDAVHLSFPNHRLSKATHELFESWSENNWIRRTGYVHSDGSKFILQCRPNIIPRKGEAGCANDLRMTEECQCFEFCHRFGQSRFDKPQWG